MNIQFCEFHTECVASQEFLIKSIFFANAFVSQFIQKGLFSCYSERASERFDSFTSFDELLLNRLACLSIISVSRLEFVEPIKTVKWRESTTTTKTTLPTCSMSSGKRRRRFEFFCAFYLLDFSIHGLCRHATIHSCHHIPSVALLILNISFSLVCGKTLRNFYCGASRSQQRHTQTIICVEHTKTIVENVMTSQT